MNPDAPQQPTSPNPPVAQGPPVAPQPPTQAVPPAAPPAQEPTMAPVPSSWPGAFGIFKYSKAAVKTNLGTVIGLAGVWIAVFVAYTILSSSLELSGTVDDITHTVLSALITPAMLLALFAGMDRQKLPFGEALSKGLPFVGVYLVQSILLSIMLALSLIALIVPFFFVAPRVALAPYYLVRKKLGIWESIKASWAGTKGHVGKVYGIVGVFILMLLPVITIIGIPVTIYLMLMYAASFSVLYGYVAEGAGAETPATPTSTAPAQAPVI